MKKFAEWSSIGIVAAIGAVIILALINGAAEEWVMYAGQ